MKLKVYLTGIIFISSFNLFSQEKELEAYRKTFRSELKVVESKLVKRPNNPNLNYKYGLLCYRLCRYREAQKALYSCMETYKNNAYYFLDLYHVELALKNKQIAQEYYYKHLVLSNKLGTKNDSSFRYQEVFTKESPNIVNIDPNSIEYFPFVLNNDRIKFLTLKDFTYTEPTSPLLFRNYLTNIIVFCDNEFHKFNKVKQPNKNSEGFSYGTFCLNKNQDKLFMTRYDGSHQRMIICVSEKNGLNWGPFRTLTYFSKNTKFNFIHPMLTENEDQLIFASNMSGGYGGYDLWIADISEDNDLKNISNLGNTINTMGNECFPTCYNKDEIFFSSDGHPGYGSLDLYRVNIRDINISYPINLGSSINSARDDYGLFYSQDAKTAYFTSNRSFSNANLFIDKIYKIKINVFNCELVNCEIRKPVNRYEASDNSSYSAPSASEYVTQEMGSVQELTNKSTLASRGESNQKIEQLEDNAQSDRTDHKNSTTESPESSWSMNNNPNESHTNPPKEQPINKTNEPVKLYQDRNERIEEKFIQYSDNASIPNLKTDGIIENKFWATAKLWFADYNLPIGFTYVRVINPKNEVIYSNYSNQNGMISVEVVEANEYVIEIPRFRTMKKGIVFSSNENNFFFPYGSPLESSDNRSTVRLKRNDQSKILKKSTYTSKERKKNTNSKLAMAKTRFRRPLSNYSKDISHHKSASSKSSKLDKKNTPRNMIENFN